MSGTGNSLYPLNFPKAEVVVDGRLMSGGRARIIDTTIGLNETFNIPLSEFAVIALLAARAVAVMRRDEPRSASFVETDRLLAEFKRLFGPSSRECVAKHTCHLRDRIGETVRPTVNGSWKQWRNLIETSPTLGRRISVRAENLTLILHDRDLLSDEFKSE